MSTIEWFVLAVIGLIVSTIVGVSLFKTRKDEEKVNAIEQPSDRTQETQVMTGRPEAPINNPIQKPVA
ncbi:MAG: hypothetical protein QM703_13990 [Gemmatales bacterium]